MKISPLRHVILTLASVSTKGRCIGHTQHSPSYHARYAFLSPCIPFQSAYTRVKPFISHGASAGPVLLPAPGIATGLLQPRLSG
ncbi:hypothetical protein B0J18DRAFT_439804 [Chaetomium sp. MPI-SDFR-AT-0129]|nr:hypothetical protein B0J18DRAFT_439804 [Chaetomium sp. MPI-SDFR-AT-0129]